MADGTITGVVPGVGIAGGGHADQVEISLDPTGNITFSGSSLARQNDPPVNARTTQIPNCRWVMSQLDTHGGGNGPSDGGGVAWGDITGTLSDQYDLNTALNAKQPTLISGVNIRTVNGQTLLGSSNLEISGGGGGTAPGHNVFYPESYGAVGNTPSHDDAPGLEAAIEAAVAAAIADGTYTCVVQLQAKTYYMNRAPYRKNNAFAQVCIPPASQAVALVIRGPNLAPGMAWYGWNPMISPVIRSTVSANFSTSNGPPSIIGGPNYMTNAIPNSNTEHRIWLIMENITVISTTSRIAGLWFEMLYGASLYHCRVATLYETPANHACGVVLPAHGNMHGNHLHWVHIAGFYCGMVYGEHTSGDQLAITECVVCMAPDLGVALTSTPMGWTYGLETHSAVFDYVVMQVSQYYLGGWHPQNGVQSPYGCVPTVFTLLNLEEDSWRHTHILDANNRLRVTGNVSLFAWGRSTAENGNPSTLRFNGGAGVNLNFIHERFMTVGAWGRPNCGPQTAPSIPSSGTELQNPFGRSAHVSISGGSVSQIQLRAGNTMSRTQVGTSSYNGIIPSNGFLTLTYTSAPTWAWSLF